MPVRSDLALRAVASCALFLLLLSPALAENRAAELYKDNCATCHGAERLGGSGPALLPESLTRLKKNMAGEIIAKGELATQMPAFGDKLSSQEISALTAYIYTPPAIPPKWDAADIRASHVIITPIDSLPAQPVFDADPLNLFVIVETGDHHITILDGDRMEPIHRFPSHFALHGGPKFTPDGRFVYFASRDGWITKFDLYSLQVVSEIRAGINTRNLAISADGKYVMVANMLPHTLVALNADDLSLLEVIPALDKSGHKSSRVSAVYQAAPRKSFIVALKDVAEVWEVFYGEDAPPVYSGLVHSHEEGMVEGLSQKGPFPIRRIEVTRPLDDFFFDQTYTHLFGSDREGQTAVVVHMDVGREIGEAPLPGLPHLGSGITWEYKGRPVMATPHLRENAITIIDMKSWKPIKKIKTLGPGFFLRSHENSPYAWAGVFSGPNRDVVHIIDKATLKIVKTLRPEPGKTAAHTEFTRDGRYVLLSIWEKDGAIIVYDAKTLKEVKRIPMSKPSGKYNVYNKITRSEGTSH
ncbi:MAG: c-type cytochrome [Rhodospirillaceae bacterium]|jgi:DNA-binding beta-propeller fold protein YncE/cytochrome c553|nr:c-type cytochrome [Rhodospirillaceae bacterium]MBT5659490.1 c-type cytochrome [Rhodospirillaceae bacterium]MBT5751136.1 c-type cytochrome [Rhodospirillaceae bacterium]